MKTAFIVVAMAASVLSGCITAPTVEEICEAYPDTLGCTAAPTPTPTAAPTPEVDQDRDGYPLGDDCDDGDSAVNPGETESCNLIDDNCDGAVDEGVENTYYLDGDDDGFGSSSDTTSACAAPEGYVANGTDCDDGDGSTYPGAMELCGSGDKDCDAGYRLTTEAEWEYAARAGTRSAYHKGSNLYSGDSDGDGTEDRYECSGDLLLDNGAYLDDITWYCGNDSGRTEEVGQLTPNAWGLYDMNGNVWEWCNDGYDDYDVGVTTDPIGGEPGSSRVERGGSWSNYPLYLLSANRTGGAPGNRDAHLGFRIARSAPQAILTLFSLTIL